MQYEKAQSGFSLIEVVLYIGLFVIILGSVLLATYNMIDASDKSQYQALIHNEAQFINRKFAMVLNGASSVNGGADQIMASYSSGPDVTMLWDGTDSVFIDGVLLNDSIAPVTAFNFTVTPVAGSGDTQVTMEYTIDSPYYNEVFTVDRLVR